jgi:phosphoribosylglycinamide formyltransferase-1
VLGERPDLLQALLDVTEIEVAAVARDRSEADAPPPHGLPCDLFGWWPERGPAARERREEAVARWFRAQAVDMVVAAGWLWLLTPAFIAFDDRIVNVRPTLLPAFSGRYSVERAVEQGVRVHRVTVDRIDEGSTRARSWRRRRCRPTTTRTPRRCVAGWRRSSAGCSPT